MIIFGKRFGFCSFSNLVSELSPRIGLRRPSDVFGLRRSSPQSMLLLHTKHLRFIPWLTASECALFSGSTHSPQRHLADLAKAWVETCSASVIQARGLVPRNQNGDTSDSASTSVYYVVKVPSWSSDRLMIRLIKRCRKVGAPLT